MRKKTSIAATGTIVTWLALTACGTADEQTDGAGEPAGQQDVEEQYNEADAEYTTEMIQHHQQAVAMAEALQEKDDVDPDASDVAEDIETTQQAEIELMESWLESWGHQPDEGHEDHENSQGGTLSQEGLESLEEADGQEASDLFLEQMIAHYEGAVTMAEEHMESGENPIALELSENLVAEHNAEISQMEEMLHGAAEASSPSASVLEEYGLEDASGREIVEELEALPMEEKPTGVNVSVESDDVVFTNALGEEDSVPLPEDEFYLSIAPYTQQTHDCFLHSLTGCEGELDHEDFDVTVTDQDTGDVVVDEQVRSHDNGFFGLWLPRDIDAELSIESDDGEMTTEISTGDDDLTCLTDARLLS